MKREVAAAIITFAVTAILVPPIRRFCRRTQILDRPGALKVHAQPIPRLGGVAIFFGVIAGVLVSNLHDLSAHWQFVAAIFVIWAAGLIDDLRGLPAAARLGAQALSALLLWQGGWRIPLSITALAQIVLLCLFVILFVNSFNFLDGSDGLATGASCLVAVSYLALPGTALTPLGFSAALCMAAACAAFLFFNRQPASIFPGDSGSTLLGFLVAFIGLEFANTSTAPKHSIVLAVAIAALPTLDALRVIVKRIARRAPPMSGDRNHFYDALLAKGWTPQKVAAASWTIVGICGAIAVCIVRLHASIAWSLAAFVAAAAWINLATSARDHSKVPETTAMLSDFGGCAGGSQESEASQEAEGF